MIDPKRNEKNPKIKGSIFDLYLEFRMYQTSKSLSKLHIYVSQSAIKSEKSAILGSRTICIVLIFSNAAVPKGHME